MKKKTNSINYAQKYVDNFFYAVFAPIVKAARPKKQKKPPAIRELEKIFTGVCGRILKEQLTTTFAELLDMTERGVISAKTLGAMLDTVKEKVKLPADALARLDKVRDLAYKIGKDSVKNPPAANIDTSLTDKLASEWARTDNSWWIGNAFENVGNRLSEKIPEYIEAGMGRKEAGERLEELFAGEYSRSKTYWRGLAATALNRSRVFGQITGYEAGGVTTYEIRAMMDERTSPICKFMNGKRFTVADAAKTRDDIINSEPQAVKRKHPWLSFKTVQNMSDAELQQAGFIMPPFHFHCRTTTVAVETVPAAQPQADYNALRHEAKVKQAEIDATPTWINGGGVKRAQLMQERDEILKRAGIMTDTEKKLFFSNIEYLPVQTRKNPLSEEEIIRRLAGGDETEGSCASVALAYAGQKQGFDVLDFRDGESREFFSSKDNKQKMFKDLGATVLVENSAKTDVTNGKRLLNKLEAEKEYYLGVGGHAAIVRVTKERQIQYLELQSKYADQGYDNGWYSFGNDIRDTLKWRFGCTGSSRYIPTAYAVDISQLKGDDAFRRILGYINTSEDKQHKGAAGSVK